ncbi:MAG: hypothetical protein ACKVP1_12260 [Burkholderiaceae bacterium]
MAALAACERRAPAALSRERFAAFNTHYVSLLRANGFGATNAFPVGRSNMAPLFDAPSENTLHAFAYATPGDMTGSRDFVISGKPEITDDGEVVAPGDLSAAGMVSKARYVMEQLRLRVDELGCRWTDINGAQAYTIHSLDPVMDELRRSGLGRVGLSLFPAYPPVIGWEFEIDVRFVSWDHAI